MSRRIRIAILGASPCDQCTAACCKQHGPEFAALLAGEERRRFAPFAQSVTIRRNDGALISELVLPYVARRCQFLGDDDRCTIYEDRPAACRAFECATNFNGGGIDRHGEFLKRNERVLSMLKNL